MRDRAGALVTLESFRFLLRELFKKCWRFGSIYLCMLVSRFLGPMDLAAAQAKVKDVTDALLELGLDLPTWHFA
ncbi:hypothetical protein PSPO01_07905 [Paraphaeosphaeria sporulosa]